MKLPIAVVIMLLAGTALPEAERTKAKDTEVIYRQKFARQEFAKLTAKMLEAAQMLAVSEPESARAIRQAVAQAQGAFIAEDMDRVIQLLAEGLLAPADRKEARIIAELKNMLEVLRSGAVELDEQRRRLAAWKRMLGRLDELIARQNSHELASRIAGRGHEMAADLVGLQERLADIVAGQKELIARTAGLQPAGPQADLAALHAELGQLKDSQATLTNITAGLAIAHLQAARKLQTDLAEQAAALAEKLTKTAVDPAAAASVQQAADVVARASGEMVTAADQLGDSNKTTAGQRQGQASADLAEAAGALEKAMEAMGGKSPFADLAADQGKLAAATQALAGDVKAAAGAAGEGPEGPNDLHRAAEKMDDAEAHLTARRKGEALTAQEQALRELTDDLVRLARLQRRLADQADRDDLQQQQSEQGRTEDRARRLAADMKDTDGEGGSPAPGQPSVARAADAMAGAAGSLGRRQADQANAQQSKAMAELAKARRELTEAVAEAADQLQSQTLVQVDAMLQAVLAAQKKVNAETVKTYAKRRGRGYARAEQLKLADLARRQGDQAEQVGKIVELIEKEGTTAVFPAVLKEVRKDMGGAQDLLGDRQAGPLTQGIQEQIAGTIADLLDSLRKAIGQRQADGRGSAGDGQPPLVPIAAELKMLRAMQDQINRRTELLNEQTRSGALDAEAGRDQHKRLSDRQSTLTELTEELDGKIGHMLGRRGARREGAPR